MRRPYAAFASWAANQVRMPDADQVRKRFGCSQTTALEWLDRWQGQQLRQPTEETQAATERVLADLATRTEPTTVRGVADATGLPVAVVTHAMQNLFEASRVLRHGQMRPYTYTAPSAMPDLALLAPPNHAVQPPPLVASLGVTVAALHRWRIAA